MLADDDVNVRINGTDTNLWGVVAKESHSNLGKYYNESIAWVESMIQALGVPDHGAYPMSRFVLPPAPEGSSTTAGRSFRRAHRAAAGGLFYFTWYNSGLLGLK